MKNGTISAWWVFFLISHTIDDACTLYCMTCHNQHSNAIHVALALKYTYRDRSNLVYKHEATIQSRH